MRVKVCNVLVITVRFRFISCTCQTFLLFMLEVCMVLHRTFFRLSTLIRFGSCKHCSLVCFLCSKKFNIFPQNIVYKTPLSSDINSLQLQFANRCYVLPRSIPVHTNIRFIQFCESLWDPYLTLLTNVHPVSFWRFKASFSESCVILLLWTISR
jgi:hypothetical protein